MELSALKIVDIFKYIGLSSSEANERQRIYGFNIRPAKKRKTWLKRLWDIFTEPMMFLILCTSALYFIFHDTLEAIIILASIVPIGLIEFIQEGRTDKALEVLDKYMVQYCLVYRDSKVQKLEAKFLVPGDLVHLSAGDKIPADGFLINSPGLMVDESILTGESVTVIKSEIKNVSEVEDENQIFQGTFVASGEGKLLVESTGGNTKYGKLGLLLSKIETQSTPLQKKIHKLVRSVAAAALIFSAVVALIVGLQHGMVEGLLAGLTMAMSLVPEEFPVVFSVFLILGVLRLAKEKALTREMVMVETLGSATVICTDKTGTLTEGRMSLEKIYYKNELIDKDDKKMHQPDFLNLAQTSLLALERVAVDPIEIEMQNFGKSLGIDLESFFANYELIVDSPFEASTKMVHHIWQNKLNRTCAQYTVGASEMVIKSCDLSDIEKNVLLAINDKLASDGYRILAVATKDRGSACEGKVELFGLNFVGLLVMSDPPRAGVKEAMEVCQGAGIRIIMITGDNKLTAHNIAESLGMRHNENILSGDELAKFSEVELQQLVKTHDIFARIRPEQKYLIVKALQKNGEVVAMTGDGVNDAPALKCANIGIAMGEKGTEVARAAAGIVLLDDNFSTIVNAVHEGRRIYDNMRKAFTFLFSFHLPIVGLALIPLFFGQSMVFLPIHIIFLELICDPAAVLGFEREKARRGLLTEPPRPVNEPLINPKLWSQILVQGLGILVVSLLFYYYGFRLGDPALGSTLAFSALVVSQVMLILLTREWNQIKSNKLLLAISLATLVVLMMLLNVPAIRIVFHFTALPLYMYWLILLIPFLTMSFISLIVSKFNSTHKLRN